MLSRIARFLRRSLQSHRFVRARRAPGGEGRWRVEVVPGLTLLARREDFPILEEVFHARRYSNGFPFRQAGAVILDIGAHIGAFSAFAARHAGPGSRILAYEPEPENFALLEENLRASAAGCASARRAALWRDSGEAEFLVNTGNRAGHSLFAKKVQIESRGAAETIRVPMITLDDIFENEPIEQCEFLKMDCEGAEYDVLYAASPGCLDRVQTISLEFHDVEGEGRTARELARYLVSRGFTIERLRFAPTRLDLNFGELLATREPRAPR